jgi:hypothetical protein
MWSTWWIDIDSGKPKNSEKNLSHCHFVHHKSHWIDPDVNLGHHGERPATNCLRHGTFLKDIHYGYVSEMFSLIKEGESLLLLHCCKILNLGSELIFFYIFYSSTFTSKYS